MGARWSDLERRGVSLSRLGPLGRGPLDPPEPPASAPAHSPVWRAKPTLDGAGDLYRVDCSCGYRGSAWYSGEEMARRSWERHLEPGQAAAA